MNRNKSDNISEIANILSSISNSDDMEIFIEEVLTPSEIITLSKRWRILKMLKEGRTQREISNELKVSLCKVTRGSQILKDKNSVVMKYLTKER